MTALLWLRQPVRIPRHHWRELLWLSATNMFIPHVCIMYAVSHLTSGRAAILTYTMPIFSALLGASLFHSRLNSRAWLGVSAATLGVVMLLWNEMTHLAGNPLGVGLALLSAATWALGTHLFRRTAIDVPASSIAFWMMAASALLFTVLSALLERAQWAVPSRAGAFAIGFNAIVIMGVAQAAWFTLARSLPPLASTVSVMFIPILGLFSGAFWLNEVLNMQDYAAVALMTTAIASVLWPSRQGTAP